MQILNTIPTEIQTGKAIYLNWSIGCIIGIIVLVIILMLIYLCLKQLFIEDDGIFATFALLGLIVAILLSAILLYHPVMTPINQYEVIMDDTVPFVEVIEKYDFIEQHGDIYILQDKVPEK